MRTGWTFRVMTFVFVGLASPAMACQIPVFRYALENWQPDPYVLIVAHRGELSPSNKSLVDDLQRTVRENGDLLNLELTVVDLA